MAASSDDAEKERDSVLLCCLCEEDKRHTWRGLMTHLEDAHSVAFAVAFELAQLNLTQDELLAVLSDPERRLRRPPHLQLQLQLPADDVALTRKECNAWRNRLETSVAYNELTGRLPQSKRNDIPQQGSEFAKYCLGLLKRGPSSMLRTLLLEYRTAWIREWRLRPANKHVKVDLEYRD